MRLPKERLAELLAERDNEVIQPIVIPSQPTQPYDPWRNPYPYGPVITYADSPNTNDTEGNPNLRAYHGNTSVTDGKEHNPSFTE